MSLASLLARCPVSPRGVNAAVHAEGLSQPVRSSRREAGFTLIEVMVTMAIASALMAVGVFGFTNWQRTSQQRGTAQELVSALRSTAVRAVSEGRTYCVDFDNATTKVYAVYRVSCSTGTLARGGARTAGPQVSLTTNVTSAPCTAGHKCIYFYPRGTATPATVNVTSSTRSKVYIITVEGLTARVYM